MALNFHICGHSFPLCSIIIASNIWKGTSVVTTLQMNEINNNRYMCILCCGPYLAELLKCSGKLAYFCYSANYGGVGFTLVPHILQGHVEPEKSGKDPLPFLPEEVGQGGNQKFWLYPDSTKQTSIFWGKFPQSTSVCEFSCTPNTRGSYCIVTPLADSKHSALPIEKESC